MLCVGQALTTTLGGNVTDFTRADVEVLDRQTGFKGFYRLDVLTLRHRLFNGGWGPALRRELFVRHDAVCVLPYDPWLDQVVLIEQVRIGAIDKSDRPWMLELVAGLIDKDESPEAVAHREAEEEAGLKLLDLTPITRYFPSPGGSDERVYLYLALVDSRGAGGIHGLEEEGEDIRVSCWSRADAMGALSSGRIDNAATIIALQWLEMNVQQLRDNAGPQP